MTQYYIFKAGGNYRLSLYRYATYRRIIGVGGKSLSESSCTTPVFAFAGVISSSRWHEVKEKRLADRIKLYTERRAIFFIILSFMSRIHPYINRQSKM